MIFACAVLATVPWYSQCGGKGYDGPTTCDPGAECKFINEYYSQVRNPDTYSQFSSERSSSIIYRTYYHTLPKKGYDHCCMAQREAEALVQYDAIVKQNYQKNLKIRLRKDHYRRMSMQMQYSRPSLHSAGSRGCEQN